MAVDDNGLRARLASSGKAFRPAISIIGAGRMGVAYALAFYSRGYVIEAIVSRTHSGARRAAKVAGLDLVTLSIEQLALLPQSEILLITTPDSQLSEVAKQLASTVVPQRKRRVALHSSGALSSSVLRDLGAAGFAIGSMHPLVSVSDPKSGARRLEGAYFGIEGEAAALRAARKLIFALGGAPFLIDSNDKALYHAAAVMSSGNIVALVDIAIEMLVRCGLTRRRARTILLPLLESTIQNLGLRDTGKALTGPFARSDVATVKRHLSAISRSQVRDALSVYLLLGRHAHRLAKGNGPLSQSDIEMEEVLTDAERYRPK